MFSLAVTTRPIKFPRSQCAGMYAFNELFYTIAEKLQTVVLLPLQITPQLSAVKTVAYCLKHYIHSYGGEVLGSAGRLARCRKLPCPHRRAQALTQACARTRMSVHTQGVTEPLPPPQRTDFAPQHPHLPRAEQGWSIPGTWQRLSGQRCSLSPARNRGAAAPLDRKRIILSNAVAQVLPSPAEEHGSPRGQALPPPRAKGIRLERSSTVPSPRRRQLLQAEAARGETGAAKLHCFSWSYFSSSLRENEEK